MYSFHLERLEEASQRRFHAQRAMLHTRVNHDERIQSRLGVEHRRIYSRLATRLNQAMSDMHILRKEKIPTASTGTNTPGTIGFQSGARRA